MLSALATTANATSFGVTATDANLLRASTRVRGFVGQQISAGSSTVTARGPVVRLPERPVTGVDSVLDWNGDAVDEADSPFGSGWWLSGNVLTVPTSGLYTVAYDHGYATVPDGVIEIVVTVAARMGATDSAVASGVQQETSGSVNQSFGWDAWKAVSGLTTEEKAVLSRLFPKVPRTLVMRG